MMHQYIHQLSKMMSWQAYGSPVLLSIMSIMKFLWCHPFLTKSTGQFSSLKLPVRAIKGASTGFKLVISRG